MGNDLRERLEALMKQSQNFMKRIGSGGSYKACYVAVPRLEFLEALESAFEDGKLATRSEMEEAVAKAVAEEREAMAHETSRLLGEWIRRGKLTEKLPDAPYIVADYRARSEQKEGE